MSRKLSLQNRILILVCCVTLLTTSVIVWFDSFILQRTVHETYVSQLDGMTTAINGRYEESHEITDVQQIFDYIQYKNANVLELTLYGEDQVLASTDRTKIGSPTPNHLISELKSQGVLVNDTVAEDGTPLDRLTAPLREDGIIVGGIEMLLNTSESEALIEQRSLLIMIVGFGVTVLLMVTLYFIIRKLLIRPLLNIREAVISVKEGEAYKPIPLEASQEINEVSSAFNEMVHNQESRYNELQQAMDTIRQAQKQLVESEKMVALGSLVAGVSHEINTPLGIGVTAASFLEEKAKTFEQLYQAGGMKRSDLEDYLKSVRETTGMLQANLMRASELVKSFKQVAVDRSVQTKRKFPIKEYIRELLISLHPHLKKTKHQVFLEGSDGIEIDSDPGAVSQIITNLIMNSIIHAYEQDDSGRLSIGVSVQNDTVTIRYADDGKGMTAEVAEQIFNPFFTTNRSGGGTGLGMHIVYNLVTQSLGGTIRCESEPGSGTEFIIEIPMNEG